MSERGENTTENALHGDPFSGKRRARDVEIVAEFDIDFRDGVLVDFAAGPACEAFEELFGRDEQARDGRFEVRSRRRTGCGGLFRVGRRGYVRRRDLSEP